MDQTVSRCSAVEKSTRIFFIMQYYHPGVAKAIYPDALHAFNKKRDTDIIINYYLCMGWHQTKSGCHKYDNRYIRQIQGQSVLPQSG
jgi:hypothetical protein